MTEPVVFEPVIMKDVWDCGVSCIAMLTGTSWQDVRKQIRFKRPEGLSVHEVKRICKALGHPLVARKDVHTEDIGMLVLDRLSDPARPNGDHEGHYVMFFNGSIYNPAQNEVWTSPEAYTAKGRWTVVGILKRREERE